MEGKKLSGSSCLPPSSSSSLAADLLGGKNTPTPSSSSLFHSVFPPVPSVKGRDSSQPDIFGPLKKYEVQDNYKTVSATSVGPDGMPQESRGRGESILNNNKNSVYQHEKVDPCLFGSSVYYGGRDICTNTSSSPDTRYNYKKDGEDDSNNSNAAFRGNWWEGSLYY